MATVESAFTVPQGDFQLTRPGASPGSPLRAWDAADEYLLNHIPESGPRTLIVNDGFGALAVALAQRDTTSVSDSLQALRAAATNLSVNGRTANLISSVEPIDGPFDLAVIKIPRTRSLLEHQLHTIRASSHPETVVIGAGMVKHIHTSTLSLFEQIIGLTTTSLAKKKARLIHADLADGTDPGSSPWPKTVSWDRGLTVVVHAGVFGGTKLDLGTRVLLDNLPELEPKEGRTLDVVDLGCGNGIVGTVLANNPSVRVTFVDESYLAVSSADATFRHNHPTQSAETLVDDCGESLPDASFDVVLNNPPFHRNNELTDATAWKMFNQSQRILRTGGELRVVGNRHLGYHAKLRRIFGNCAVVGATPKFVVLSARA
ncbi:MAG: methyltransferase [Acidimicrobiales bacterium]